MMRSSFRSSLVLLGALAAVLWGASVAEAQRPIPINIESVPPGATVYLDSTNNPPLGTTPLRNVRVPRGDHTIIFQLLNHEEARLQVNVRRRRETFRAVLRALGTVEVSAGNTGAQGATVSVDGRQVGGTLGATPVRVTDLQPGRHQVRVSREGYDDFEQWVEVGGGQLVRVAAVLQQSAPDTGSILVSGPPGAPVFLDGAPRGATPTVIEGVSVGSHTVEIRAPGRSPYSQTVTVLAGQRATVAMGNTGGTLRVLASAPGAVISIDGEVVGPSPGVREGLAEGEHIVTATAEGYERAQQTVTVTAGQQRVISIEMQPSQGTIGRILVEANVDAATVIIDGEERGQAPVVFTPPEAGPHAVVVRADGHQEYSTTCETAPGQNCEISATLVPQQVRVRVAVQPGIQGAELFVDGEVAGPVPYDGTLPAGSHVISVTAPGFEEYRQQVLLQPSSEVRPFDITLPQITDGMTDEQRQVAAQEEERIRGATVTRGAAAIPVNQAVLDLSLGWPYIGMIRLGVGLWGEGDLGLDAGFTVRSSGRLTEFAGRVRFGARPIEQLAVGGMVEFGGGIGPELSYGRFTNFDTPGTPPEPQPATGEEWHDGTPNAPASTNFTYPTNSLFLTLQAHGSLYFGDQGAFTLWVGLDLSSDEYPGHGVRQDVYVGYQDNTDPVTSPSTPETYCVASGTTLDCPREDWARARLGGSLELVLTRNWNLWFMLEGILNQAPRRIHGNILWIPAHDTQFYFRIGTTHKF